VVLAGTYRIVTEDKLFDAPVMLHSNPGLLHIKPRRSFC
jgi:hypothetical protein